MHSIFITTSIELFDSSAIFDFIDYNIPSVFSSDGEISAKTSINLCDLCRQIKIIKQTNNTFIKKMDSLSHTTKELSIKNEILKHENIKLQKTLIAEQKR